MNEPELQNHLATLVPRRLPDAWKAGILRAVGTRSPAAFPRVERFAWGAIAAAWILILALRVTTPSLPAPSGAAASARDVAEHWRQVRFYAALDAVPPESSTTIHLEQEFRLPIRPRS